MGDRHRTGESRLNRQSAWARALLASVAVVSAVALSGCDTDGTSPVATARAMAPLSNEMLTLLEQKNMPKESPILVRLFKEEAELEVWKQDASGQYALLKTYPICRWSGELGPKVKEGDRQAPEGFYTITPGQMNPNSAWYLSFNLGFPNAYDRANDRTGQFLMVHGDCSSAGCYAMTDEQMGEIYALAREPLLSGQKAFHVQAYPFRLTSRAIATTRRCRSGAWSRKATIISRRPGRSRRSACATSATCSTSRRTAGSFRAASARRRRCRTKSPRRLQPSSSATGRSSARWS